MPKITDYKIKRSEITFRDSFDIETPSNIWVISKTKSGKTFLISHILQKLQNDYDEIYIMGGTIPYIKDYNELVETLEKQQHSFSTRNFKYKDEYYKTYFPTRWYPKGAPKQFKIAQKGYFDLKQLKFIYMRQKFLTDTLKMDKENIPRIVFLLDDVIGCYRAGSEESQFISTLSTQARHLNISLIVSVQHTTGAALTPTMRNNATNVLFYSITEDEQKDVAKMCHVEPVLIQDIVNNLDKYEFCYYSNDGVVREAKFLTVKVDEQDDSKSEVSDKISIETNQKQ